MNDRDTFAAAALTGLIANGDYSVESTPTLAWRMADAMLRERERTSAEKTSGSGPVTLTDEEREAIMVASIELNTLHCWEENHSRALRGLLERLA